MSTCTLCKNESTTGHTCHVTWLGPAGETEADVLKREIAALKDRIHILERNEKDCMRWHIDPREDDL